MTEITYFNSTEFATSSRKDAANHRANRAGNRQHSSNAVANENRRAAVDSRDRLSLSFRQTSRFKFSYNCNADGCGNQVSFSGRFSAEFSQQTDFQSKFSFGFKVNSNQQVELNEGVKATPDKIQGDDFEFDRKGVLSMLEKLIEKLNAQDRKQIDLGGELDGRALELLQQLGLIDEEGKATPLLQMLSDYAGLNRFQAGQQVKPENGQGYQANMRSGVNLNAGYGAGNRALRISSLDVLDLTSTQAGGRAVGKR